MKKTIRIMTLLILTSFLFLVFPVNAAETLVKGEWIIDGSVIMDNQTLRLDGQLTIKSGGSLYLKNSTILVNCTDGIRAESGGTLKIDGCKIEGAEQSIRYLIYVMCDGFELKNTQISGCEALTPEADALTISGKHFVVENNTINGRIIVKRSKDGSITKNKFIHEYNLSNATDNAFSGMALSDSQGIRIERNEFRGFPGGIYATCTWNSSLIFNKFYLTRDFDRQMNVSKWWNIRPDDRPIGGFGFSFEEQSNNNRAIGNTIYGASCTGFKIVASKNNIAERNIVKGVRVGAYLVNASGNLVINNTFSDIWEYEAIELNNSYQNHILNNTITESNTGFCLFHSDENILSGNSTSGSGRGYFVFSSSGNSIENNEVKNCTNAFIIDGGSKNIVKGNNFFQNSYSSIDKSSSQISGNYWGEYSHDMILGGTDTDPAKQAVPIVKAVVPQLEKAEFISRDNNYIEITDNQIWEDKSITLDHPIIVKEGGSLTLRNTTLIFSPAENVVDCRMRVQGGNLEISDSKIIGPGKNWGFSIEVKDSNQLIVQNSEFWDSYEWQGSGVIRPDNVKNVLIKDNNFENCYTAVTLINCGNSVVTGNTFTNSFVAIEIRNEANTLITNNIFDHIAYHCIEIHGRADEKTGQKYIIKNNTMMNSYGEGVFSPNGDYDGIQIEGNKTDSVIGPGLLLTITGFEIRAFRLVTNTPSNVKAGQSIDVTLMFTGVYAMSEPEKTTVFTAVILQEGKEVARKMISADHCERSTVRVQGKAVKDGVYDVKFYSCTPELYMNISSDQFKSQNSSEGKDRFGKLSAAPYLYKNTVMVPAGDILDELGGTLEFNKSSGNVKITRGKTIIQLAAESNAATVNGKRITLPAPVQSAKGYIMVPLSLFSEQLHCAVQRNGNSEIVISTNIQ